LWDDDEYQTEEEIMATPAKPTKEQWDEVKRELSTPYCSVYFLIDGYAIVAQVDRAKMRLVITVYVNGYMRGEDIWYGKERDVDKITEIARRFYCQKRKAFRSAKDIKDLEKLLGKRECKKKGIYDKWLNVAPWFSTPGAFITHIKKHNQDIQIVDYDTYKAARDKHLAAIAPEVASA
jgi:hypothetical protein